MIVRTGATRRILTTTITSSTGAGLLRPRGRSTADAVSSSTVPRAQARVFASPELPWQLLSGPIQNRGLAVSSNDDSRECASISGVTNCKQSKRTANRHKRKSHKHGAKSSAISRASGATSKSKLTRRSSEDLIDVKSLRQPKRPNFQVSHLMTDKPEPFSQNSDNLENEKKRANYKHGHDLPTLKNANETSAEFRASHGASRAHAAEPKLVAKKDVKKDETRIYIDASLHETNQIRMALEAVQPGKPQHDEFKKFMLQRGISMETAKAFYVGVLRNRVAFPKVSQPGTFGPEEVREKLQSALPQGDPRLLDGQYVVQRIKLRGLKEKKFTQSVPGVDLSGLFGWHLVKPSDTEIVITEGEMDALAVYEATKRAVVSLPGGAPAGLTGELVDKIKARFKTVYLWLDNDEVGLAAREKLAQHFGMDTVRFIGQIGQGNKDANDVLMNKGDVEACIRNAKPAFEEPFDSVQDMKELIRNYMLHPEPLGESFDGFPSLTSLVGGFRPGELTILTGPTGSGKTTLLSQLSLHLAQKGVKTLWGSFEIKREALLSNMLRQYAGSLPEKGRAILRPETSFLSDEEVLGRLDQFATLPLYALKFFGATDVVDVLDSVAYSVTEAGMQHVIIDNLQFMVSGGGGLANAPMTSWDRFESMDSAIGHFRQIATQKRCHVTVVIHPRKEKEGDMLSLQSFSGTGKATQEADNVWILQKDKEGMKSLDVKKNRFLGTLGSFPLEFAFPSRSFVDLGDNAVKARSADLDKARSFYADENLEF